MVLFIYTAHNKDIMLCTLSTTYWW